MLSRRTLFRLAALALVPLAAFALLAAPGDPEFVLVPGDAAFFATARVADLSATEVGKEVLAALPKPVHESLAEFTKKLGAGLPDMARVTFVVPELPARLQGDPEGYVVLQLKKALDPKQVEQPGLERAEHNGKKYLLDGRGAMFIYNDRTLVVGLEAAVKRAIDQAVKPRLQGPAVALLVQAEKKLLAFGLCVPANLRNQAPFPPEVVTILEARTLLFTGALEGRNLVLEFEGNFPDAEKGVAARKQLDELLERGKQFVPPLLEPNPQLRDTFKQAFDNIKASQEGARVRHTTRTALTPELLKGLLATTGPVERPRSQNNLKQIAIAFHAYHDANGKFDWAVVTPNVPAAQAKPLHSWRVALLPYLEEERLFKQIRLNEPWNSPFNSQFHKQMPKVYELPGKNAPAGTTHYLSFIGPGAIFARDVAGRKIQHIKDGTSNTLLVVEAAQPVNWMEPADLEFVAGPNGYPLPGKVGGHFPNGFNAAFVDGSVRFLPMTLKPGDFQALITIAGGENVTPP